MILTQIESFLPQIKSFVPQNDSIWDKKDPIWGMIDFIWGTEKFLPKNKKDRFRAYKTYNFFCSKFFFNSTYKTFLNFSDLSYFQFSGILLMSDITMRDKNK